MIASISEVIELSLERRHSMKEKIEVGLMFLLGDLGMSINFGIQDLLLCVYFL